MGPIFVHRGIVRFGNLSVKKNYNDTAYKDI